MIVCISAYKLLDGVELFLSEKITVEHPLESERAVIRYMNDPGIYQVDVRDQYGNFIANWSKSGSVGDRFRIISCVT